MKKYLSICLGLALVLALAGQSRAEAPKTAAPAKPAAPAPAPRSVFTQPTNAREGRDPFFPESTHVFDSNIPVHAAEALTTLTVKGFSVVNGRPMVIINNHTFMTGDEGDVLSGGTRAHVRCLEIRPGVVVVEVNGAHQEIRF